MFPAVYLFHRRDILFYMCYQERGVLQLAHTGRSFLFVRHCSWAKDVCPIRYSIVPCRCLELFNTSYCILILAEKSQIRVSPGTCTFCKVLKGCRP